MSRLADGTAVEAGKTTMWGGRLLVPVRGAVMGVLGRPAVGLRVLVARSADLTAAGSSTPVGSSGYYHVAAQVAGGHFIQSRPINLTVTAALELGVARRTFAPAAGVAFAGGNGARTAFVAGAILGVDVLVHSRISLLADFGTTLGFGGRGGRVVSDRLHPLRIGVGVRF